MRLKYVGHDAPTHKGGFRACGEDPWQPGDVREVPDEVAQRRLADFPGAFVAVPPPSAPGAPAPPAPAAPAPPAKT